MTKKTVEQEQYDALRIKNESLLLAIRAVIEPYKAYYRVGDLMSFVSKYGDSGGFWWVRLGGSREIKDCYVFLKSESEMMAVLHGDQSLLKDERIKQQHLTLMDIIKKTNGWTA